MSTLRASMLLSFVPIITQWPASGGSALIGYAGRFTARTVSKETKESSAIITAPTQIAALAALGGASISYLVLRRLRPEVPEKLNGAIEPVLKKPRNAIGYAKFYSRPVIRVYDGAGNVIETRGYAGEFKEW
jgi:hypothetical protein